MTGDPVRPGLHPLSHLKAGPTVSSSPRSSLPSSSTSQTPSRPASRIRHRETPGRDEQLLDSTSDKATASLIRRTLCPGTNSYQPLEELLPPLTSSNDVDRQVYALLAIVIREFVYSWYSKITPDHLLVNEIIQVTAHCTRALEQRLRQTDVAQLLLDELPALVESHLKFYRLARQQSNLCGLPTSEREVYHALNPHPGLSPVPDPSNPKAIIQQQENEAVYRQLLVRGTSAVLLPTEDLENVCLRTLIDDILADRVLGSEFSEKACKGWFLWESATKLIDATKKHGTQGQALNKAQDVPPSRLEKYGLLSSRGNPQGDYLSKIRSRVAGWMWSFFQFIYSGCIAIQFVVGGLLHTALTTRNESSSTSTNTLKHHPKEPSLSFDNVTTKRPVLGYGLYGMLSQLFNVPRRMPWLSGLLALIQNLLLAGPGRLGDTGSVVDRFLHEIIEEYILTPTLLPNLLLTTRTALFPQNVRPAQAVAKAPSDAAVIGSAVSGNGIDTNNSAGAAIPSPRSAAPKSQKSAEEVAAVKRQCAHSILSVLPRRIARIILRGPSPPIITRPTTDPNGALLNGKHHAGHESPRSHTDTDTDATGEEKENQRDRNKDEEDSGEDTDRHLLTTIENDVLDLFADEYCNKHLVYSVLETILARLLPELSERSISELMEDRGVSGR